MHPARAHSCFTVFASIQKIKTFEGAVLNLFPATRPDPEPLPTRATRYEAIYARPRNVLLAFSVDF